MLASFAVQQVRSTDACLPCKSSPGHVSSTTLFHTQCTSSWAALIEDKYVERLTLRQCIY